MDQRLARDSRQMGRGWRARACVCACVPFAWRFRKHDGTVALVSHVRTPLSRCRRRHAAQCGRRRPTTTSRATTTTRRPAKRRRPTEHGGASRSRGTVRSRQIGRGQGGYSRSNGLYTLGCSCSDATTMRCENVQNPVLQYEKIARTESSRIRNGSSLLDPGAGLHSGPPENPRSYTISA